MLNQFYNVSNNDCINDDSCPGSAPGQCDHFHMTGSQSLKRFDSTFWSKQAALNSEWGMHVICKLYVLKYLTSWWCMLVECSLLQLVPNRADLLHCYERHCTYSCTASSTNHFVSELSLDFSSIHKTQYVENVYFSSSQYIIMLSAKYVFQSPVIYTLLL